MAWRASREGGGMIDDPAKQPRGKPSEDGRFIWLASLVVERIVNELGATQAAFAIAVYVALARLSSQQRNAASIQAPVSKIAGMARLSYRKTFQVLHELESVAKVIQITPCARIPGDRRQAPSTYTLLSLRLRNGKPEKASSDCTRVASHMPRIRKNYSVRSSSTINAPLGGGSGSPPPAGVNVERKW